MNVKKFLREQSVAFKVVDHRPTFDAQRLAQAVQMPGRNVAKAVMLRADDGYVVAVLPATRTVDFAKVKKLLGAEQVELANEAECGHEFMDVEFGGTLPFGRQYGMRTLLDQTLAERDEFVFDGNSHHQAIRMKMTDFRRVEQPLVAPLSFPF